MLISYAFVLIIAFTIHELAHALTATYFGDTTPQRDGRLTLNPLAHLDPIGSLMLIFAGFGWARPVQVNPYALQRRSPAALMLVSLAGPASNLLMAALAALPFRLGWVSLEEASFAMSNAGDHFLPTLPQVLLVFIITNLGLMLFNLIPIAPLDGDKIADYFFPPSWSNALDRIRPYGPIILLAFVYLGVLSFVINPPLRFLLNLLLG
jgi:Zn-dependent protease